MGMEMVVDMCDLMCGGIEPDGKWIILENPKIRMCPYCGHVVNTSGYNKAMDALAKAEWHFCPHCGEELQEVEQ